MIAAYTALSNRLAGLSATRSVVVTLIVITIGLSLIAVKALTH